MWKFNLTTAIFLLIVSGARGTLQQLIFYDGHWCTGENETITDTTLTLSETWMTNATSVRIIGAWKIWLYTKSGLSLGQAEHPILPPNGTCREEWSYDSNPKFTQAIKYGPDDLTTSNISLYPDENYFGEKYEIDKDTKQLADKPVLIRSFMIFSNTSWVAYYKANFTGNKTRLMANELYDGYKAESSISLFVNSIKLYNSSGSNSAISVLVYLTCFVSCTMSYLTK